MNLFRLSGQAAPRQLLAWLMFALAAGPVAAQSTPSSNLPPWVPVYRSAFEAYKPYAEQGVATWRDSNDTAARIGGWRAYAREARQAEPVAPQSQSSAPSAGSGASQPGSKP